MASRYPRESLRRFGLLAGSLLVALLLAEGILRVTPLHDRWLASLIFVMSSDVPVHRVADDPALVYTLRESAHGVFSQAEPWGDDPRVVSVSSLGYRSAERAVERPAGTLRILAIGGSNTFGAAVSDAHTWPAQLESALQGRLHAPVQVWNLGVSGWMTSQKARLADRVIDELRPDLLLFQLFNVGPRNILSEDLGDAAAARAAFERDPTLWGEQLRFVPRGGLSLWLFRGSALLRTVNFAANRLDRWGEPRGAQVQPLLDAAWARDAAALRELVHRHPDQPMALVVVPAGGQTDWWQQATGGSVLDLQAVARPDLPGIEDIHPGALAYGWYAAELARMLTEEGGVLAGR